DGVAAPADRWGLRRCPLFAECSDERLRAYAEEISEIHLRAGEALTWGPGPSVDIHVVVGGTATLSRDGRVVAVLESGNFVACAEPTRGDGWALAETQLRADSD